jgi:chromosomal replication initiation ATPase DnaA
MNGHSGACLEERVAFVPRRILAKTMSPRAASVAFEIIHAVTGFDRAALCSVAKPRALVHARWLFVLAFRTPSPRQKAIVSFPGIGAALAMDHTTIIHADRAARAFLGASSGRGLEFQRLWEAFQSRWVVTHA